ncbi:MAG: helix-turn-helix domain-containing protein [Kiritimatiellae bacterium]|nr:helix-turn-helix domain-containing protein [Kiritimatiellia bacterium]
MRQDFEQRVWAVKARASIRSWKYVLLNLCYHANAAGEAFPSVATIVRETGYSGKAVIEALAGLERLGIIRQSGRIGETMRVVKYTLQDLLTNVDKLGNSELSSALNSELSSRNSELSSRNSELSSKKGAGNSELSSGRNIYIVSKLVSKSVSRKANTELTSLFVDNSGKKGRGANEKPLAHNAPASSRILPSPEATAREGKEGAVGGSGIQKGKVRTDTPEWKSALEKMKTVGWKPKTDMERRYACALCKILGASQEEAERFVRYNATKHWHVCDFGTVNDAAKEWNAAWKRRDLAGYNDEQWKRGQTKERGETKGVCAKGMKK